MKIIQHQKNVHELILKGNLSKIAILSDIHWDNPKCDWDLLKTDLEYCKKESIPIFINGDFFCCMQGKYDRRASKSGIRPEHQNENYLDSLVTTAVEWWQPYAHLIFLLGYGNHETAMIKMHETDLLQRFADLMNLKEHTNIQVGGYSGWIVFTQTNSTVQTSYKLHYHHGLSKGASVVTKGAIDLSRAMGIYEGMDIFTQGHIHQSMSREDVRDTLEHTKNGYRIKKQQVHHMITGTYKEEYFDTNGMGWHIERGSEARNLGGRILTLESKRIAKNGVRTMKKYVDSHRFPL